MTRIAIALTFLFVTMVLAACSPSTESETNSGILLGQSWILTELYGKQPLQSTTIFIEFSADGSAGGTDGCNSMSRTYTEDGDSISFSPVGPTTLMACPEPVMDQATSYQQALTDTESYSVTGDILTFSDASGADVAAFQAQDQTLGGSSWTALSYNNGTGGFASVILDTEITADFGEDGSLGGSDGCNSYGRSFETDGNNITVAEGSSTMMACPEEIMEQADAYQQALTDSATYELIGDSLTLYNAEGTRMVLFSH